MPENIGPHLLGRIPSTPDARDYRLQLFIDEDPLVAALRVLQKSHAAKATKLWATIATERIIGHPIDPSPSPTPSPSPSPDPTPTPAPDDTADVIWLDKSPVLDQGDTGHCVGFGWCQWGNTEPVDDTFTNSDGHAVYYEAKVFDGEPGQENGSTVRSGAKSMQARKRLSIYAFAKSIEEIRTWVRTKGPMVAGTVWTNDMFTPDKDFFIAPTGTEAGGHCYALVGDLPKEEAFLFQNSWSDTWGDKGRFKIKWTDFAKLLKNDGEACATLELPL